MTSAPRPILGEDVAIDVDRLLVTKLLVQANSGGGKSYAIRRLLEQTFGRLQHIVIDPEGEFHTLRERFEYALAGKGGEAVANVKTAHLLAHRLLELGVSTIVDISELGTEKPAFVAKFLDALVNSPRELWHPVLVVVDEAHRFCPEQGKVGKAKAKEERKAIEESKSAVITLMDSGRKRGFCGVLATQRVSKLNKDATAECNNKLIGRSVEIDAKRAAEELGMPSRDAMQQMRKLQPGHFFVFGPAFCDEIRTVRVGPVATTHPEAGKAAPPPTPPRGKVREVLGKLAGLTAEAEEEEREIERLRARVFELERNARQPVEVEKVVEVEHVVEVQVLAPGELDRIDGLVKTLLHSQDRLAQAQQVIASEVGTLAAQLRNLASPARPLTAKEKAGTILDPRLRPELPNLPPTAPKNAVKSWPGPPPASASALVPAQQKVLDTMATLGKLGIESTRTVLAAWLGTHPNSKGYVNNLGALRSAGLIEDFALTPLGARHAHAKLPGSRAEVTAMLLSPLPAKQREIVEIVLRHGAISREDLAAELDTHPNTKGLVNNIGALRGRALLSQGWPLRPERVFQAGAA